MRDTFILVHFKFLDNRAVFHIALRPLSGSHFGKENAQTSNVLGGKFIFNQISMRCLFIFSHCGPRCSIGSDLNFVCAGLIVMLKLQQRIANRHRLFKRQRIGFLIVRRNDTFGMPYRFQISIDGVIHIRSGFRAGCAHCRLRHDILLQLRLIAIRTSFFDIGGQPYRIELVCFMQTFGNKRQFFHAGNVYIQISNLIGNRFARIQQRAVSIHFEDDAITGCTLNRHFSGQLGVVAIKLIGKRRGIFHFQR